MKATRRALYQALTTDQTIQQLAGGRVYDGVAPQSATYPLIVFNLQAEVDDYSFGGRVSERQIWLVKAIDHAASADIADDLADAIDDALTDRELTITGRATLYLRRETRIRFKEVADGGQVFIHSGGTFRLEITEA